jgi:hypothetical protein
MDKFGESLKRICNMVDVCTNLDCGWRSGKIEGKTEYFECGWINGATVHLLSTETVERIDIRTFDTGATRDTQKEKLDFDGFFSPLALFEYAKYLHKHRLQTDGNYRESDNWQKGIPLDTYMKSDWRHFYALWALHRGYFVYEERTSDGVITHVLPELPENKNPDWTLVTIKDALGGIIFNSMGYLHEHIKEEYKKGNEKEKKCSGGCGCKEDIKKVKVYIDDHELDASVESKCTKEYSTFPYFKG